MIDVATLAAALALVKASGGGGSGEPGFSPTVEIAEVEGGTQVTITDVNGPQTFTVLNGTNGTNGVNGQDGQDGVSPVLSIGEVTTLAAGSQATASLGGTAANPTLNLGIPQGAQGAQGAPGLDAPQIDDTQITTTNPWSSMQIVKTLCPPFKENGNPVVCYPVANYPLEVKASWEPRQEGEGDPSPENVRPITGLDSVQVTQCGKNLWNYTLNSSGETWIIPFVPKGTYTFSALSNADWWTGNPNAKYWFLRSEDNSKLVSTLAFKNTFINQRCYATVEIPYSGAFILTAYSKQTVASVQDMQVEAGSIATAYEPYQPGATATLALPETIYGGTVDAVTGEGSEEVHGVQFNGTETWSQKVGSILRLSYFEYEIPDSTDLLPSSVGLIELARLSQKISHFKIGNPYSENVDDAGWVYNTAYVDAVVARIRASRFENVEDWKSYLAAQAAAGTPVTIAYKLATPTAFQATGGQSIPALPGTNTVYTDAGYITVTGASDPIATITALQNRVSALESAALN